MFWSSFGPGCLSEVLRHDADFLGTASKIMDSDPFVQLLMVGGIIRGAADVPFSGVVALA